jgi:hypothetical protein
LVFPAAFWRARDGVEESLLRFCRCATGPGGMQEGFFVRRGGFRMTEGGAGDGCKGNGKTRATTKATAKAKARARAKATARQEGFFDCAPRPHKTGETKARGTPLRMTSLRLWQWQGEDVKNDFSNSMASTFGGDDDARVEDYSHAGGFHGLRRLRISSTSSA